MLHKRVEIDEHLPPLLSRIQSVGVLRDVARERGHSDHVTAPVQKLTSALQTDSMLGHELAPTSSAADASRHERRAMMLLM